MSLSQNDLRNLLFCVSAVLRARRDGVLPGGDQRWLRELKRRMELELAVSRSRQTPDGDPQHSEYDDWISSHQVAQTLRRDLRWVQRHAIDLAGRKVAGQFVFRASTVEKYLEGMIDGRDSG